MICKMPGNCRLPFVAAFLISMVSAVTAQTYSDIHDFNNSDGCCANYPSMIVQGRDGNIYGATTSGGSSFHGNIFKMTPSGSLTSIYSFGPNGLGPQGGISMGMDGNFYGTTYVGGTGNAGTVFKVTPAGVETVLYNFTNTTDGGYPRTPPVQAQDGNLYGATGNASVYVLYKITTSGTFTVMANLVGQSYSPLLVGTDGKLYGTTLYGGTANGGTAFQFTPSTKTLKTLHNFATTSAPEGPLMQGTDGNLYGTTSGGGTSSGGVVFKLSTSGTYTVLYNFSTTSRANGATPTAGLVQGSDKYLYGVCSSGGANNLGVLFKISTTGTGFMVLHDFATATGDSPLSTPLLHTNGKIYGLTYHGGSHVTYGVVYSLDAGLKPFVTPVVLRSAKVGATIEMIGQGFSNATGILFGAAAGTFVASSDTYLTAKPAAGATTAAITVQEPGGNLLTPLKFKIVPTINSPNGFTPTQGPVGTVVTITGMSLSQATAVKFGGVAATTFTVNSNTQVTATVPTGAITGKISVVTPGGTANSSTVFTVK